MERAARTTKVLPRRVEKLDQSHRVDRLHHVLVDTRLQRPLSILGLSISRQRDETRGPPGLPSNESRNLVAVHARQPDVDENQRPSPPTLARSVPADW